MMDVAYPDRISDLGQKNLIRHQGFDIRPDAARAALAEAIRTIEKEHGKVGLAMQDFFLQHCSVQDLIHPSSV